MAKDELILIVDDEPVSVMIIEDALKQAGYRTASLSDGKDVVQFCKTHLPAVVLLDVVMPETEGAETMMALASALPEQRVIAISASEFYAESLTRIGADGYLTKPISPVKLLAKVREVILRPLKK